MIRHILKDGTEVKSVSGIVIKADQFYALYRMMEKIAYDTTNLSHEIKRGGRKRECL